MLTKRPWGKLEKETLLYLTTRGFSNQRIAVKLDRSKSSVTGQLHSIYHRNRYGFTTQRLIQYLVQE